MNSGRYHQTEDSIVQSRNDTENFFDRDYFNMPFDESNSNVRQDRGESGHRSRNESGYSRTRTDISD